MRLLIRGLTLGLAGIAMFTMAGRASALAGPVEAVHTISSLAGDRVVLAPEPLAEDLAAAGVTVWVSNPIDAFRPEDQAAYLDVWLGREGGRRAIAASDVVVATPGSPAHRLAVSAGCSEVNGRRRVLDPRVSTVRDAATELPGRKPTRQFSWLGLRLQYEPSQVMRCGDDRRSGWCAEGVEGPEGISARPRPSRWCAAPHSISAGVGGGHSAARTSRVSISYAVQPTSSR